jgi:hypothetical protein
MGGYLLNFKFFRPPKEFQKSKACVTLHEYNLFVKFQVLKAANVKITSRFYRVLTMVYNTQN